MFDTPLEKKVDELVSRISQSNELDEVDELAEIYGDLYHPEVGYRFGEKYLLLNAKKEAVKYLLDSACFGLNPEEAYLKTGYADAIGHSMWYLINSYDYAKEFDSARYNLYCGAYFCLSVCINGMGISAYDSLRTRALMVDGYDKTIVKKMLSKYYYDGDDLCTQILSLSDFFFAAEGFRNNGKHQISSGCLVKANENMNDLLTLPQYSLMLSLNISDIANISKQNQKHLVKNLIPDFRLGAFQMRPYSLRQAVEDNRIISPLGFWE